MIRVAPTTKTSQFRFQVKAQYEAFVLLYSGAVRSKSRIQICIAGYWKKKYVRIERFDDNDKTMGFNETIATGIINKKLFTELWVKWLNGVSIIILPK